MPRERRRIGLRPGDLLAAAMPPGPTWVQLLEEAWDRGAAVMPIDDRLPRGEVERLMARARPTVVDDGDGPTRLRAGIRVDAAIRLVVATSGTSAAPKLAELTDGAIRTALRASCDRLEASPDAPWYGCLPVAHMGGLLVALRGAVLGTPVLLRARFDARAFVRDIGSARFTSLVPTMLHRLVDAGAPVDRFDAILVGGAALDPDLADRASAAGADAIPTYGSTETCGGVVYDGRPLDGLELRLGERDEILLRGPMLMRGYRLDGAATSAAIDGDGWFHTGDAGAIGPDGSLEVAGRLDDLIVTGGEKVWPDEVEAVLTAAPQIAEAAVVGVDDAEWGQLVVAFVVPSDPARPPSPASVRAIARARLARAKVPREVVVLERLPRTRSGKVRRSALTRARGSGARRVPRPSVPRG